MQAQVKEARVPVTLMNFGDNDRYYYDCDHMQQMVHVGEIKSFELPEPQVEFIAKAMRTDTIVMLAGQMEMPKPLAMICSLLREINTAEYTSLLVAYHQVVPQDPNNVRPSRDHMRLMLRDAAYQYAHARLQSAGKKSEQQPQPPAGGSQQQVHDDVPPEQLQRDLEKQQQGGTTKRAAPKKAAAKKPVSAKGGRQKRGQ